MRRLSRPMLLVAGVFLALPVGSRLATPACATIESGSYRTAVVLAGGLEPDGSLKPGSAARSAAGVDLLSRGIADSLLFSGASEGPVSTARLMQEHARALGAPAASMTLEEGSFSTLENALFSRSLSEPPVVLVTDGYHAWRSWLSFVWAGDRPEALCRATRPRPAPPLSYLRESAAWPVNLFRAPLWSLADALGLRDDLPGWVLH